MRYKRFVPTKENMLNPRPCRTCGQMMSREFLEQKNKDKCRRISEAFKNSDRIGRKRAYDYDVLRKAYEKHGTFRKAADALGISTWPIIRAVKELK